MRIFFPLICALILSTVGSVQAKDEGKKEGDKGGKKHPGAAHNEARFDHRRRAGEGKAEPLSQKKSDSLLRQTHDQLGLAKAALRGADHDYHGHRADALRAVEFAERQIHRAFQFEHGKAGPVGPGGANLPTPHTGPNPQSTHADHPLPQAVSNEVLKQTISNLESMKSTLQEADHDYGGHRASTVRAIDEAVNQLNKALGVNNSPGRSNGPGLP